jgi:hypothetical protein
MLHRSKSLLFAAIAFACAAMVLPSTVEARGGGGRGGGGGGGGGRMGGGAGSFSRGGGGISGGSGFRGFNGNGGNFNRSGNNFSRSGIGPFNRRGGWDRWNGGWGWGWGLGVGYWGFGSPYWYGGYPFWYDRLAYGAYVNPYYTNAGDYGGYDYGQPIAQSQNPTNEEDPHFAAARAAFYAGNYQDALREITQAVADMPSNQDVHEFHGLVLFAMGDYQKAAAIAHTTLDSGPGWNWSVVQTFYPSVDTFTQQLRNLEHYVSDHPNQASTRFLLGYEYLTLGHLKASGRQFDRVVALEPRDGLAKNIVAGLAHAPGMGDQPSQQTNMPPQGGPAGPPNGGPPSGPPNGGPPSGPASGGQPIVGPPSGGPPNGPPNSGPPSGGQPVVNGNQPEGDGNAGPVGQSNPTDGPGQGNAPKPPEPVNPPANAGAAVGSLNGSWKSSPAPGVTIEATLQPDKHFTWKFTEGGQTKSFSGTYTQQGDSLVLTRDEDGQKMDGTVTMNGTKGFRFRLRNTDPNDPGLDFAK